MLELHPICLPLVWPVLVSYWPLSVGIQYGITAYVGPQIGMTQPIRDSPIWNIDKSLPEPIRGVPESVQGLLFFVFFFSHAQDGLLSPKIEAIPMPWRTSPHQKFRQPTHCALKSRIRRTREGAASPHIAD
jgi:hypothetical protein